MSDEEIKIEKGIPIPKKGGFRGGYRYPFDKMEIGDSFLLENIRKQAQSAASAYKAANPGWDYVSRTDGDKVRIWRIA